MEILIFQREPGDNWLYYKKNVGDSNESERYITSCFREFYGIFAGKWLATYETKS